jgi:two-component system, OmpR family, response regulator MprA
VLLVDDDAEARRSAVSALEQALVPVRQAADGMSALEAMSTQRPDVLVLELALGEPMRGRDLLKIVKATKEWVDIPIVLYTRQPISGTRDAQLLHGADELVLKGTGAEEALINRVIHIFQRGQ